VPGFGHEGVSFGAAFGDSWFAVTRTFSNRFVNNNFQQSAIKKEAFFKISSLKAVSNKFVTN
jgi:hypothetical protein